MTFSPWMNTIWDGRIMFPIKSVWNMIDQFIINNLRSHFHTKKWSKDSSRICWIKNWSKCQDPDTTHQYSVWRRKMAVGDQWWTWEPLIKPQWRIFIQFETSNHVLMRLDLTNPRFSPQWISPRVSFNKIWKKKAFLHVIHSAWIGIISVYSELLWITRSAFKF